MLFITKLVIIFKFHEVLQSLIRIFNQIEKKLCKGRLQVFPMHIFLYFSIQLDFIQIFFLVWPHSVLLVCLVESQILYILICTCILYIYSKKAKIKDVVIAKNEICRLTQIMKKIIVVL